MAAFNLSENAFAILGTTPRANRAQIEDAYQVALLDAESPEDEEAIHRAHRSLTSPRERLDCELSFFLDATPAKIRKILASLRRPNAEQSRHDLTGSDLANLLAHNCSFGAPVERLELACALIVAHGTVSDEQVHGAIQALRVASGFGAPDLAAVRAALIKLRERHANVAVEAILANEAGPTELATQFAEGGPQHRPFLEIVAKQYEHFAAPQLLAAVERVRPTLEAIRESRDAQHSLEACERELRAWDVLAQPLQIADRNRGIDEHNSIALFQEVHSLCLDLANEQRRYVEALRISKVAEEVFAELPTAARKLAKDIATLTNLAAEARQEQQLLPLVDVIEAARSAEATTRATLKRAGFTAAASSPVSKLHDVFASILHNSGDTALNDLAAQILRNFAVELCNRYQDSSAALALINGALSFSHFLTSDMISELRTDQKLLRNNVDFDAVKSAMENGRLTEASAAIDRMLPAADNETRATLIGIKRIIAERKNKQTSNLVGWAVGIAALFLVAVIADSTGRGSSEQSNSYDYADPGSSYDPLYPNSYPSAEGAMTEAAPPAEGAMTEAAPLAEGAMIEAAPSVESPPAPYASGARVTLNELRYCQRQKARIEAAEPLVASNPQVDRFNAAVEDYNARCGSFQYRPSDMNRVLDELSRDQSAIQAEARDLIGDSQ